MGPHDPGRRKALRLQLVSAVAICIGLMVYSFMGWSGDPSSTSTSDGSPQMVGPLPAFPLAMSDNHRYLVDLNGRPFPILGRTAWFITSLSETDYKRFIDDTVAKGFSAIEFHVINHDLRGHNPPFSGNGALPFIKRLGGSLWDGSLSYIDINTDAPDFTQPSEAYWRHVDAILAYAESKGILCFIFPAYTGAQGEEQGWMQEMVANGSTKVNLYGAFIANRYRTRRNIVWMLGGDYGAGDHAFTAPQLAVERAMIAGMQTVNGQANNLVSAEWDSPSIYTDQTDPMLRSAGTLQGAYSWQGDVNHYARKGYSYLPVMPTFLLEEPYDQEGPDGNKVNPHAIQPVRRFQWWGWLSGIGGYIAGNGCVWPFNSSKLLSLSFCSDGWQAHLNTQGAKDMARLNAFVRSITWYNLVPSGLGVMKAIVTAGGSQPILSDYVAASASPDGALLVAYIPPDHIGSITIDMTVMSGQAQARWFNPASAAYTVIGSFPNTGTQTFVPPGNNGTGFTDWVLLMERQ